MHAEIPMVLTVLAALFLLSRPQFPQFALAFAGFDDPHHQPDKPERKAWEDLLLFKKGSSSAPKPDANIGKAALKEAELGEEWLKFAREQYGVANDRQAEQDKIANEVTQQQLTNSRTAQQWATEDRARYKDTFQPLQDDFINTAKSWDSKERQDKLAAEAKADVINNAAQQRQSTERNMASMGVNPTSGRFAGVERSADVATALAGAGAENTSRNNVRKEGVAMKADAVNMGNGLAVNPANSLGLSTSGSSAAMGTTSGNNAQAAGNAQIMGSGYQAAMSGYGNQASILNQQYSNQLSAWQSQQQANASASAGLFGGLGNLAGMGLMAWSSKELKEDKRPVEGALDAVNSMPVEQWKYKEGVADEGEHIGPYAEDFAAATGKGDGKAINLMDSVGLTMKAVQELSSKVDKIADAKGVGMARRTRPKARVQQKEAA